MVKLRYLKQFHHYTNLWPRKVSILLYQISYLFFVFFFSIRVFFHEHWRLTGQQGKAGDHFLFHSTTSTRSRTFRHLFATLHVRWLSYIFNRSACIDCYSMIFYPLIELPFDWLMMWSLFQFVYLMIWY